MLEVTLGPGLDEDGVDPDGAARLLCPKALWQAHGVMAGGGPAAGSVSGGLAMSTRPTNGRRRRSMAAVLPVASSATSSSSLSMRPKATILSWTRSIRCPLTTLPSSRMATWANAR